MPADRRLTIETLKPGMKVRCVDATSGFCDAGQLREGEIYTVKGPRGDTGDIWLESVYSSWEPSRFIPADPEPAPSWATEELRKAHAALKRLLARDQRNTCLHEETHRGGAIWEICDQCGAKWADDEGGKPLFCEPVEWAEAEEAISAIERTPGLLHSAPASTTDRAASIDGEWFV